MARFDEILKGSGETLLKLLYRNASTQDEPKASGVARSRRAARGLDLSYAQLVCALGFNPNIRELPDIVAVLGFASYDALAHERNLAFVNDVYQQLGIKDVLAIYQHVARDSPMLEVLQHLLPRRLDNIEQRIEATVNAVFIDRYKKEARAIYADGVAQIDFAETRLAKTHSGFRALLNEVALVVESRLIPIGDIFFRETILPEEKRRLIISGLIPRELIESRLTDSRISARERTVLEDQLKLLDA